VIVLDNTVENTKDIKGQMDGLIFTLNRGISLMKHPVRVICRFSLFYCDIFL